MIAKVNMGIEQRFETGLGGEICLGSISKVISGLSPENILRYKSGHSHERAQQLACADLLATSMMGKTTHISRDVDGAPFLPLTTKRVSISHTYDYMAMIISSDNLVAIDIEMRDRRVDSFGRRFLADDELNRAEQTNSENPSLLIWSIKECLFKIAPVHGMLFKEHLLVHAFEDRNDQIVSDCEVRHKHYRARFSVVTRIFDPLIMSYIDQATHEETR